jgi:hypothetical protein
MPDGHIARAQGFVRYEGGDWLARRAVIAKHEALYGRDGHPDPESARRKLWGRRVATAEERFGRNNVTLYFEDHWSPEVARYLDGARAAIPRLIGAAWKYWLERVLDTDGWYMPRHVAMPDHPLFGGHLVGQLRPDVPAVLSPTGWEWHHHWFDLGKHERRSHEASVCTWSRVPRGEPLDTRGKKGKTEYLIPTGHLHPDTGEIVVPYLKDGRYVRHRHWEEAKYVYTPGDTAKGLATHPESLEHGFGDGLFVVVLEGTLKMCAVTEAGFPCIDAGSVTLWQRGTASVELDDEGNPTGAQFTHRPRVGGGGPMRLPALLELQEFAERHLNGRPVAVVCDSDWSTNEAVRDQTEMVAGILRPHVGEVFACAPPDEGRSYGWRHPLTGTEQREKLGIDDWIAKNLEDGTERHDAFLEIGRREQRASADLTVEHPGLLIPQADGRRARVDGRRSTVALVKTLGELATPDGVARYELNALWARLRADGVVSARSNVQDAYDRAVKAGLLTPLTTAVKHGGAGGVKTEAAFVRVAPEGMPAYRWRSLREWLA